MNDVFNLKIAQRPRKIFESKQSSIDLDYLASERFLQDLTIVELADRRDVYDLDAAQAETLKKQLQNIGRKLENRKLSLDGKDPYPVTIGQVLFVSKEDLASFKGQVRGRLDCLIEPGEKQAYLNRERDLLFYAAKKGTKARINKLHTRAGAAGIVHLEISNEK